MSDMDNQSRGRHFKTEEERHPEPLQPRNPYVPSSVQSIAITMLMILLISRSMVCPLPLMLRALGARIARRLLLFCWVQSLF